MKDDFYTDMTRMICDITPACTIFETTRKLQMLQCCSVAEPNLALLSKERAAISSVASTDRMVVRNRSDRTCKIMCQ